MIVLIVFLSFMILVALSRLTGRPTSVILLEYQRAVLYRRGLPVREVGPGRHWVWTGSEKLMIVDTRPIQVSYENQRVALADGSTAEYSISGTARVQGARKASYCARNYNQLPGFVLICCARLTLNGFTANQLRVGKDHVVEEIINRAKPRLAAAGFELLAFRISQLSVAGGTPRAPQ
ncbi:MAG: SPFH domain-containing protein [Candidatus Acidiferrales bacterium]